MSGDRKPDYFSVIHSIKILSPGELLDDNLQDFLQKQLANISYQISSLIKDLFFSRKAYIIPTFGSGMYRICQVARTSSFQPLFDH